MVCMHTSTHAHQHMSVIIVVRLHSVQAVSSYLTAGPGSAYNASCDYCLYDLSQCPKLPLLLRACQTVSDCLLLQCMLQQGLLYTYAPLNLQALSQSLGHVGFRSHCSIVLPLLHRLTVTSLHCKGCIDKEMTLQLAAGSRLHILFPAAVVSFIF